MNYINIDNLSVIALSDAENDEINGGFVFTLSITTIAVITLLSGAFFAGVAAGVATGTASASADSECDGTCCACGE